MFLKSSIFKRLLKESYSTTGLRLHNDGDGLRIVGRDWAVWVKKGRIAKKELASIIELTGEIPEAGECFLSRKGGNQHELRDVITYDVMGDALKCRKTADVTRMLIKAEWCTMQVLQDRETKKVTLLNENFVKLINKAAIEQGEAFPVGPVVGENGNIYWFNDTMALMVLPISARSGKGQKLVENLEKFKIQEGN